MRLFQEGECVTLRRLNIKVIAILLAVLLFSGVVALQGEQMFNAALKGYLSLNGISTRFVHKNGATVFFFEGGKENAETVILLHGVGGNALTSWFQLLPELSEKYHVVAPDMFFANLPDLVDSGYHISSEKALVELLYDQLNISKASLVGLSFGAWPALQMASDYPGKVGGVVLISPLGAEANRIIAGLQLDPKSPGKDFYYRIFETPPPVPGMFLTSHWERTSRVFAALPRFKNQLDIEGQKLKSVYSKVECPVITIHGKEDRVIPRQHFERLGASFGKGSVLGLEQSGHAVVWDQPDQLALAVESFLERLKK